MLKKSTRIRRALLAAALAAGIAGGATSPANATANVTTNRLAGNDRYGTAAAVATNAYPSGADTVIIASGRSFPDALAGAALAARQAGPVLLTEPSSLPAATSGAIDTLKATKAVILGGTTAVSQAVEDELKKKVTVSRVSGTNRYDTAAKIAAAIGAANIGSTGGGKAALIATGANFADALAGGALSAAGSSGVFPVLLVDSGVPSQTRSALTDLGIKQAIILGGTSAVSQAVADELQQITGNAPQRIAGSDRYATAAEIAKTETGTFSFSKAAVYLANGENFADALAGGALGGKNKTPILLTPAGSLAAATSSYLTSNKDTVASITALGGTAAISDATLAAAKAAAQGESTPTPTGISVAPADDATQAGGTTRTYTASGLTGPVDIALVDCEAVTDSGRFDNANDNTIADGTGSGGNAPDKAATEASIQTVNGTPNLSSNNDYADDVSPSDGKVTFVVSGPSNTVACVQPVVFTDANSDDALNSNAASPATPTEAFGLGSETTFAPADAGAGTFTDRSVAYVDAGENLFVACQPLNQGCTTFRYDSGDTFKVNPPDDDPDGGFLTRDLSGFEAVLSGGDGISITYQPGNKSEFLLTDSAPAAPDPVTASRGSNGLVTVSFPDSRTGTVDAYQVYRGTAATAPQCAEEDTSYDRIGSQIADGNANTYQYIDSSATPTENIVYCYKVSSIDGEDEGQMSSSFGQAT